MLKVRDLRQRGSSRIRRVSARADPQSGRHSTYAAEQTALRRSTTRACPKHSQDASAKAASNRRHAARSAMVRLEPLHCMPTRSKVCVSIWMRLYLVVVR